MEKKKKIDEQQEKEVLDRKYEASDEDVFKEVVEVVRENFVATFIKENDTSLLMRFVNGRQFRLTVEKVV